jgi:hypothetical protein
MYNYISHSQTHPVNVWKASNKKRTAAKHYSRLNIFTNVFVCEAFSHLNSRKIFLDFPLKCVYIHSFSISADWFFLLTKMGGWKWCSLLCLRMNVVRNETMIVFGWLVEWFERNTKKYFFSFSIIYFFLTFFFSTLKKTETCFELFFFCILRMKRKRKNEIFFFFCNVVIVCARDFSLLLSVFFLYKIFHGIFTIFVN